MKKALVTGIGGFTGVYLYEALKKEGFEVFGLDPSMPPSWLERNHFEQVDLLDESALAKAVAKISPEYVFHLAGISHVMSSADLLYRVNVVGTRNLLSSLAKLEKKPSFVLLVSSANVYGNVEGVVDENTPPHPQNDYAVSKLAMEYMASLWQDKLPITIVRPFNYTGKGQSEKFLIPKLVKHFKEQLPVIELGNTDVIREFNDVRDVVSIYVHLALKHAPWGPFNICSGEGYSLQQALKMLEKLTNHTIEVRKNPLFVRANEVKKLIGSPRKLNNFLGENKRFSFNETLQWMLNENN